MDQNALLAVGPFVFYATAPSFQMLRQTLVPRWSEVDRVARAPAGQFLGPDNTTVDIHGVLYPDTILDLGWESCRDLIDNMTASANAGDLHVLIGMAPGNLTGYCAGRWYIKQVQNERTIFDANGAKKITFQVTLRSYGEDDQSFDGRLFG